MEYIPVSLPEMMEHREKRSKRTAELLSEYKSTVICMSMNFIGEYKVLKHSRLIFNIFCNKVLEAANIVFFEKKHSHCGDYAHFVSNGSPEYVKSKMRQIEESTEVGRLFDIDVFYEIENGMPIQVRRDEPRKCLLCDKSAVECARNRTHGIEAVREETTNIMRRYIASLISECAYNALISEVETTPKPGLVDKNNNGAHTDMNIRSFYASSLAIKPYYYEMAMQTFKGIDESMSTKALMQSLQVIGHTAEKAMFEATKGVNTQIGEIYTIGLLSCGAILALEKLTGFDTISQYAQQLALSIKTDNSPSFGARYEAENAFPNIMNAYKRIEALCNEFSFNEACVIALIETMLTVDDTNILRRGGDDGLNFMRQRAKQILDLKSISEILKATYEFDMQMIESNLSPGGCADILAASIFMLYIKQMLFAYEPENQI